MREKVVVITGAAGGIGKAITQAFINEGAICAICDRDQAALQETAQQFSDQGEVFSRVVDVTDEAVVQSFVREVSTKYGRIDALANNAGISPVAPFLEMPYSLWEQTINVNLNGLFLVAQAVAKQMAKQAGTQGSIINMSSTNGLFGEEGLAAYNASKAGVILLTKTMALELADAGIRVNAVCPGFIATDLARSSGFDESFLQQYTQKIPLRRQGRL